ncbi:uncharacterized protein N7484_010393 [Penicillium longicatenatum]|uniref:uncharacterized protein n=1 Tax=Penicillium longicatenatum TaxID=1561947 RepID=UPI0025468B2D|nr:uncharacterized protein N7484_010393 [Penicillium longicatenatum]KAJ5630293.1 hypothetical protein N7484_010393 [Penicillium longicatenatum]
MSAPQTYDIYDPSLPADHPFVTRASQFQFHLPLEPKSNEIMTPQPWCQAEDAALNMGYLPPDFSAWNSGLSTISDPQSPRSSNSGSILGMNCIASPAFRHEDISLPIDEYPAPDGLVDIDHSIAFSQSPLDRPLDHPSPFDTEFDAWSGSQSDRNVTPEQQWSAPFPTELAFPQPIRQNKSRPARAAASTSTSKGVRKSAERRPTSNPGRSRRRRGTTGNNSSARTFTCSFAPYGCESTFVSKNEWKRHVTSQHLQLGFYRCDVGKCSAYHQQIPTPLLSTSTSTSKTQCPLPGRCSTPPPGQPNDFNRKDLFTQHHRRMHAPWHQPGDRRAPSEEERNAFEASLEEVRQRCWHGLRTPPLQSHCGFCKEVFSGEGSWDVRMEHIGRHFEREDRRVLGVEEEDLALREWGVEQGILVGVDGGWRLASLVGL